MSIFSCVSICRMTDTKLIGDIWSKQHFNRTRPDSMAYICTNNEGSHLKAQNKRICSQRMLLAR